MPDSNLAAGRLFELDSFLIELNAASAAAIEPLFRADHGLEDKGGMVRVGAVHYNTLDEVAKLGEALKKIAG